MKKKQLFFLADSATELETTEIIQILSRVICIEQLDIGDRIKVTITLGHAIENSGIII
jgi:hypothetical protein